MDKEIFVKVDEDGPSSLDRHKLGVVRDSATITWNCLLSMSGVQNGSSTMSIDQRDAGYPAQSSRARGHQRCLKLLELGQANMSL